MIDPIKMTRYDLSRHQLEETLLFSICVAGKNAITTAKCLDRFLKTSRKILKQKNKSVPKSPFKLIKAIDKIVDLPSLIQMCGMGCYNFRAKSFKALVDCNIDLANCDIEELERIPGIGPKTSRFFILHTRRNVKVAALDVHILKYMSDKGIQTPKVTPVGKKYVELEQKFLELAEKSGKTVAEFDLEIWREYSRNPL